MPTQEEPILRKLFQRLKQDDEGRASSFSGAWAAAHARLETDRRPAPARRWRFAAAATASLLLLGGLIWRWGNPRPAGPQQQARTEAPASPLAPSPRLASAETGANGSAAPRPRRLAGASRRVRAGQGEEASSVPQFYPLVEEDEIAPFESGRIVRIEVPAATLVTLGVPLTEATLAQPIQADLLLGQDGLARAIRFLPNLQTAKTK